MQREGPRVTALATTVERQVKNGTREYEECMARCARGFRCRRLDSGAGRRRCALLCAGAVAGGRRRRRLWADILQRET